MLGQDLCRPREFFRRRWGSCERLPFAVREEHGPFDFIERESLGAKNDPGRLTRSEPRLGFNSDRPPIFARGFPDVELDLVLPFAAIEVVSQNRLTSRH